MKIKTEFTPQIEQEIINFYSNHTARETIQKYHLRLSRLNKLLATYNVNKHKSIKTKITPEIKTYIKTNYESESDLTICKKFHITKPVLYKILQDLNIARHSSHDNFSISLTYIPSEEIKNNIINFYLTEHTLYETAKEFNMAPQTIAKWLTIWGIKRSYQDSYKIKSRYEKIKQTNLKRYGVECPGLITRYSNKKIISKYYYDTLYFDSSWELATWIYCKDHNIAIERLPIRIAYNVNNEQHYYYPDFKINNVLVEIKGDYLIENNQLKKIYKSQDEKLLHAKSLCMQQNNIKIYTSKDLVEIKNYITTTYGKDYLKRFKNTQKATQKK